MGAVGTAQEAEQQTDGTTERRKTLFDADALRLRGALALAPTQIAADDFERPSRNEPGF